MKKRFFVFMLCLVSASGFAASDFTSKYIALESCGTTHIGDSDFCKEFERISKCNCNAQSPVKSVCNDMDSIYTYMVGFYGDLDAVCQHAEDTQKPHINKKECIDDWNYYRKHC